MNRLEGTIFIVGAALLALSGCTKPETLVCDREQFQTDKFGNVVLPDCLMEDIRESVNHSYSRRDGDTSGHRDTDSDDRKRPFDFPDFDGVRDWMNGTPSHAPETSPRPKPRPHHAPETSPRPKPRPQKGNPGNDKFVGRAGEKIAKGMAERGTVGNRGRSN